MDVGTCKRCHKTTTSSSSASPSSWKTHCLGCRGKISDGDSEDGNNNVIIQGRGIRSVYTKISSSVYPRAASSHNLRPCAKISDKPAGGKRALLCGVSYKNNKDSSLRLRGTRQDVMSMAELLVKNFHLSYDSILILAEDEAYEPPTKNNILGAFEWLVKGLESGDSLVFYYAGHGKQQLESKRDETDGFDESICPLDFETEGLILDNDMNEMIVRPLKPGVRLHAIIDACHSGTILDLPHVFSRKEKRWKGNRPPSASFKGTSGGKVVCFSACEDHQEAADTSVFSHEGIMEGAMTHNFIKAIKNIQGITYLDIVEFVAKAIEAANKKVCCRMLRCSAPPKMMQDPMLSSSEEFDVNELFQL